MVIKPWCYEITIPKVDFHSEAIWIQVPGFLWNRIGENVVQFIEFKLGKLLGIDKWEYRDQDQKPFFRIRMELDLKKPLVGGFPIPHKQFQPLWCNFGMKN